MGVCVTNIQREKVPKDIQTDPKPLNASSISSRAEKYCHVVDEVKNEHDSSTDEEIKHNFSSTTKTELNLTPKYESSMDSNDLTPYQLVHHEKGHKSTRRQRVRDSLLLSSTSNIDLKQNVYLNGINRFDETLLLGFIGDIETENTLIPMEICKLMLLYYSQFIGNVFNQTQCSPELTINNAQRNTVNKIDNDYGYYSAYNPVWIESISNMVIIYNVSFTFVRATSIYIGFSAFDDILDDGFWWNTNDYNYAMSLSGVKYSNGVHCDAPNICLNITSGDSINVKLDLINNEISVNEFILFKNIKKRNSIQYKFAVGLSWNSNTNDSITINNIKHYGV